LKFNFTQQSKKVSLQFIIIKKTYLIRIIIRRDIVKGSTQSVFHLFLTHTFHFINTGEANSL